MVDATLFVAIAIACVIALLLMTVVFVYCLKRHHDKQQNRELHDRRAREERHRRHLMRAQVVRPPPYDPQRRNVLTMVQEPVPFTPPPEYKELATPLPPRDGRDGVIVGIGSTAVSPTPAYRMNQSQIIAASRNVAPANTSYSNNNNNNNNNNNTVTRLTDAQNTNRTGNSLTRNNINNQTPQHPNGVNNTMSITTISNNNTLTSRNARNQTNPSTTVVSTVDVHSTSSQHLRNAQINTYVRQPNPDPPSYSSLQQHQPQRQQHQQRRTTEVQNNSNYQPQTQDNTTAFSLNQSSSGIHPNRGLEGTRAMSRTNENGARRGNDITTGPDIHIEDLSLI